MARPLSSTSCSACGAILSDQARFCHRCGVEAGPTAESRGPPPDSRVITALPWAVAALALGALVALLVGQRLGLSSSHPQPADTIALPDSIR